MHYVLGVDNYVAWRLEHQLHFNRKIRESVLPLKMYFMSDPQALHVTRNVIPGKFGVDLHLHRVHIPLVPYVTITHKLTARIQGWS